jgi:ribose transport system substrate-binding protein
MTTVPVASADQTNEPPAQYRFVLIPKVAHPWYDKVREGALEQARFLEAQTGARFEIDYRPPTSADVAEQNRILEEATASRADGIALDLLDPALNRPVMAAALAAGIPMVAFDTVAPEGLGVLSIGNDFGAQATMAAERLVELMGGKGKVAIMQGVPTAPNHRLRYEAHKAVFAKYPEIEVVAEGIDQDDIARAQSEAEAILKAHPDLDGFVSCNASGPIGIGRAIAEAGLAGKVHSVGIDDLDPLLELIRQGVVDSSASTKPHLQGSWAVTALWLARLGRPLPAVIDTGIAHITLDDLDSYHTQ